MQTKPIYSIDEIQKRITPIAKEYGVERVYLFGSYARGEAKPTSDIDLRIDEGNIRGYFKLAGLYLDIKKVMKKQIDLQTTDGLEDDFLKKIEKDEVLIYGNN